MRDRSFKYPAKDWARERWFEFLPETFGSNGSVVYLPARQNLERFGYLARGLTPSQLIGAERDDGEIGAVRENAHGVHVVHGPVRAAVDYLFEQNKGPLVAANLDFDGSHYTEIDDLYSVFRGFSATDSSYLGVTSYAGRGQETLRHGAVSRSKFYSALPDNPGTFFSQLGRILSRYEAMSASEMHGGIPAEPDAHVSRELSLLWSVALATGVIKQGVNGNVVDTEVLGTFDRHIAGIEAACLPGLRPNFWLMTDEPRLAIAMKSQPARWTIAGFERIAHLSQNGQPMRRFHFEIVPAPAGTTVHDVVLSAWEYAAETPLVYITKEARENIYG